MSFSDACASFLLTVNWLSGASSSSLFAYPGKSEIARPTLFHQTNHPLPELETADRAIQFIESRKRSPDRSDTQARSRIHVSNSADKQGLLIYFSHGDNPGPPDLHDRRTFLQSPGREVDGVTLIGLRFAMASPPAGLRDLEHIRVNMRSDRPSDQVDWLAAVLHLGGGMTHLIQRYSGMLVESVSGLPGRGGLRNQLQQSIKWGSEQSIAVGLILINPDDFDLVNHRFGRDQGDVGIREIAMRLEECVRKSDGVYHYGGAIFAVILTGTSTTALQLTAEKLRSLLTDSHFLEGILPLTFSVGMAVLETDEVDALRGSADELLHRAHTALNMAKAAGGARAVLWTPEESPAFVGQTDPLNGVFTADSVKDYRNMLLLWDTIGAISTNQDVGQISRQIVDRIGETFKPDRVALLLDGENGEPVSLVANRWADKVRSRREPCESLELERTDLDLLDKSRKDRCLSELTDSDQYRFAVPLIARGRYLGWLYFAGLKDIFTCDASDLLFLNTLANQIAVAIDRAELASQLLTEREEESHRLRKEVRELRLAVQQAKMVYQSAAMEEVVQTLQKVADSDVTVLIMGESGTGKELLSKILHEYSSRKSQQMVIVDCGAIASGLIEVELFGRVKGAYTSAETSTEGYIQQANGSTLFLDEIGELPLEVQTRLLRFVQEKEFTPVGSSQAKKVDVRIVAATNRDLSVEVAAGRFREDLYYRLQILSVIAPPLRDRQEDILLLAHHFLDRFTLQYGKGLVLLDPAAEAALLDYSWPGNVRELQHTILRSVLITDSQKINRDLLQLPMVASRSEPIPDELIEGISKIASQGQKEDQPFTGTSEGSSQVWMELRTALKSVISNILTNDDVPLPLGRWLNQDLVVAAELQTRGIARRGARLLNMPVTTYRRQLAIINRDRKAGLSNRSSTWNVIESIVIKLVSGADPAGMEKLLPRTRAILLEEVSSAAHNNIQLGAELMGVTPPTYKNWRDNDPIADESTGVIQ